MPKKVRRAATKVARRSKQTRKEVNLPKTEEFNLTLEKINQYIKERAYYIWEDEGKPQGKNLDIWLKAEKEILSQLIKK